MIELGGDLGMMDAGLEEVRARGLPPPEGPTDQRWKWGDVVRIGGFGSGLTDAFSSATLVNTPMLPYPRPLWVSLLFSSDQRTWSSVPNLSAGTLIVNRRIGVDPKFGTRQDQYAIGQVGLTNVDRPAWARTSVTIACQLIFSIELSAAAQASNFSAWVAASCAPLTQVDGATLAAERSGSNIYGFPLTTSTRGRAMTLVGGGATLLLTQKSYRQQFWVRNLPTAEQPDGAVAQVVYLGFGTQPVFDGTSGVWTDYAIALEPGQTYESYPVETGSFWGNVYAASAVVSEDPTTAPWVVATESIPFSGSGV